jgi:hypothetical protein
MKRVSDLIKFLLGVVIVSILIWFFIFNNPDPIINEERRLNSTEIMDPPKIPKNETSPRSQGLVRIEATTFNFDPENVETIRPDIFNSGYFSMFDILVHLHNQGEIKLEYHFDESMNTHIVDSIDEEKNWWYQTNYTGGWVENNVFRPDHYPWKDGTALRFYKESPDRLHRIYSTWKEEITRKKSNNQKVIIPTVEIRSESYTEVFNNVEVIPHNLRNDVFKEGVITAIDVILSLEDQKEISCELQWYESIGSAGIVKSYWVEAINNDKAYGRCGYVYESGSTQFQFSRNHIHLPSDSRVLNSPEYVEYFWICI